MWRLIFMSILTILSTLVGACSSAETPHNPDEPLPEEIVQLNQTGNDDAEIYLAGGCFWGTELLIGNVAGVVSTEVGYANGYTKNPTYREVCKNSGHAETVHVVYNPQTISLTNLLEIFSQSIDPTTVNRQGNDVGVQYRTGIYFNNPADESTVKEFLQRLQKNFSEPVAVECAPIKNFYRAEDEHQQYLKKNPNGYCHVPRSLVDEQIKAKVAQNFPDKNFSRDATFGKPTADTLKNLTDLQRAVTQDAATEPPFKNEYDREFREGIYVDVTNGQPLFVSTDKFDSGCGWPAFSKPIDKNFLEERTDLTFNMRRTEVRAKSSGAHLGHVFDDGPKNSGGLRYCINSAALRFIPRENMQAEGYGDWLNLFDGGAK